MSLPSTDVGSAATVCAAGPCRAVFNVRDATVEVALQKWIDVAPLEAALLAALSAP